MAKFKVKNALVGLANKIILKNMFTIRNYPHKYKIIIALFLATFFIATFFAHKHRVIKRRFADFHCYYVTGERVLNGKNIYVLKDPENAEFRYSPLFASLMAVLALFNENQADTIWYTVNFILIIASFALLSRLVIQKPLKPRAYVLSYTLMIISVARFIFHNFDSGQANILTLSSIIIGLYYISRGKDVLGGAILSFSVMIKYTPLIFIPYFLLRKKIKLSLVIILFIAFYLLLPSLILGFKTNLIYLKDMWGFLTNSTILDKVTLYDHKNQSLFSLLYRFTTYSRDYFISPVSFFNLLNLSDKAVRGIFIIIASLLYILVLYKPLKKYRVNNGILCESIDYALLLICVILFNLNAWIHNYLLLAMPYFIIFYYLITNNFRDRVALVLLICSYVLNLLTNKGIFGGIIAYKAHFYSPHVFSALILFFILIKIKFSRKNYILDKKKGVADA